MASALYQRVILAFVVLAGFVVLSSSASAIDWSVSGSVSFGYNSGYYGGYYDDGYGYGDGFYGAGYGYGSPYWGWYGDYYYPGTGIYVYDRYRRPYRWNGAQQRYWQGRYRNYLNNCRGATCRQDRGQIRDNWRDFRGDVRADQRDYRGDVRDARQDYRSGDINRRQYQDRRQDARQNLRQDYRQERRQLDRQNRRDIGPGARPPKRPFGGAARSGVSRPARPDRGG